MKRLLIILCVVLFGYIQVGYYVHSVCLRHAAKQEMKEAMFASMPDSTLQRFSLSEIEKEMQWEEDGREFYFHGQLYDVVKRATLDGNTYLYCLNDQKEEQIIEHQMNVTKNNAGNASGRNAKNTSFSIPDFIFTSSAEYFTAAIPKQERFETLDVYLLFNPVKVTSPPPRLFLFTTV